MNVHYRPKAGTPRAYELLMGHIDYVTPIEAKIDEELPIGTSRATRHRTHTLGVWVWRTVGAGAFHFVLKIVFQTV